MIKGIPDVEFANLRLGRRNGAPLHQQISERIKGAISAGSLAPGARLPSSRSLASQLSVSRATVELAYSILSGEGYLNRQNAAGTRVASCPAGPLPQPSERLPQPLMPGLASEAGQLPRLFQLGLPALDAFPRKLWSRLAGRHARSLSFSNMVYQATGGFGPLRQAIANHLAIGRGIPCRSEQIFITAGFLGALALIARTLLNKGDEVWVEDPNFSPARHTLELAGAHLIPVPVDEEGLNVQAGVALASAARLALVTPATQFPLGVALSPQRRSQLMSWAADAGAWVIEDDYGSEFNRADRAAPAVASAFNCLDHVNRVLHVGSFSHVLFPGLRLGYLVVPASLADDFERTSALLPSQPSLLDQMVVADFIFQGHFGRHLARMRGVYAERKHALVDALRHVLGDSFQVEESRGMHVLLRLPPNLDDVAIANQARTHAMAITAISPMGSRVSTGPGLLLGFANITPDTANDAALRLKSLLTTPLQRESRVQWSGHLEDFWSMPVG
ncbi:GntR family transcriptional regulator [Paraburkholderia sp. BL6669N2]|uniref:MocR-like pyridoxine biosynthesis transcription factor PdxR n=1 Tax=Paraburkholderia sp. BL6669N2 TaxID=1938807 RepID=UPI000E286DEA|nr:PLP-dependent aminotransferase family protein [Paraburkholderia sp. BL6669N2]REG49120.1 GntR family transcriptional regulator [Paraburkholderia sp. BL6669N2]